MKKRLLMIVIVLVLAVQGVACSADTDERETGEKIEETVQPEVSWDVKTKEPVKSTVPSEAPSKTSGPTIAPTSEPTQEPEKTPIPTATFAPVTDNSIDLDSINSVEELETIAEEDVNVTIGNLEAEWKILKGGIESYADYKSKGKDVETFYEKIKEETEQLSARMQLYAVRYSEIIMNSNKSTDDKYDDFEDLLDSIYEDAAGEIYDRIYVDLLEKISDEIYEGILEDAVDAVPYKEWRESRSDEYSMWRDARSEVYASYRDVRSEVYEFYRDMRSELWNDDLDGANKELAEYREDVLKLDCGEIGEKNEEQTGNIVPEPTQKPSIDNELKALEGVNSLEELEKIIEEDVDDTIAVLSSEFNTLKGDIDSYSKFKSNVKDVEAFYDKIVEQTEKLCIRLQEYAVKYGEIIMNSNTSASDKYDDFDDMYDCIYDDACDEILDGVYNGILDDMLDSFYNGIIDDYDYDNYSEWSDILSKEYRRWSDASSDVYKLWSDTSSEVYGFWSDMQSELWNDDLEGANEDLMNYKEDVQKLSK